MVTLNCTPPADYVEQTRSIHVSWLLNSMNPNDIRDRRGRHRVQGCDLIIMCGNGFEDWVMICVHNYA